MDHRQPLDYAMSGAASLHYYLPVNDDAMRWGAYLTGIGRAVCPPGQPYPPPGHPRLYGFRWELGRTLPECAVVVITEGEGVFESEYTGRVPVPSGSLFLLLPGLWHRYRPLPATGWTERWFCLNGELVHRLIEQRLLRPEQCVRHLPDASSLAQSLDALMNRVRDDPAQNSVLLSLHALGLLGKAIEVTAGAELPGALDSVTAPAPPPDPMVSRAITMIWTRGHHAISVDQIATALGTSRRTLQRRFRQSRGHSILEEILRCRVSRAKRLLAETDIPIKAVAYLAGFPDEERMRVALTRREGLSPKAFRRRARGDS